jgi:hypothetical protein
VLPPLPAGDTSALAVENTPEQGDDDGELR